MSTLTKITEQKSYQEVLTAYGNLETAYHARGREVPALRLTQDPDELCMILQRMLHEVQYHR